MADTVIPMREMQRNYSKLIRQARSTRRPVFLGARGKTQAVLMEIGGYERLAAQTQVGKRERSWAETSRILDSIAKSGRQNVSLSDFVVRDRKRH
jgi:PHD/YefM family antitoxin component YafN of YafNO toxin-antitoxin module